MPWTDLMPCCCCFASISRTLLAASLAKSEVSGAACGSVEGCFVAVGLVGSGGAWTTGSALRGGGSLGDLSLFSWYLLDVSLLE